MGNIFGYTGVKEPPYVVVWHSPPYEIRQYEPYFVAEIPMSGDTQGNSAFMGLAQYIGVFGDPKNQKSKSLP